MQRHRRPDRRGAAHHRDRRRAGRAEPRGTTAPILGGVVELLHRHTGIRLLAYRPLGGRRSRAHGRRPIRRSARSPPARRDAVRGRAGVGIDSRIRDLPLPGATRSRRRVNRAARAQQIALTDADRAAARRAVPARRAVVRDRIGAARHTSESRRREIVMVMGIPGAGKSTLTRSSWPTGYPRLNRDESGGTLRGLLPALERALRGAHRASCSTTPTCRASRGAEVIQAAAPARLSVRCVHLSTASTMRRSMR